MKPALPILLIDNGSIRIDELHRLLGSNTRVVNYDQIPHVTQNDYRLIVLSGSSLFPFQGNQDHFKTELGLIRESSIPLIGICFGCELIATAFGGALRDMHTKSQGLITITPTIDSSFLSPEYTFTVYESHRWRIAELPDEFISLAASTHGPEIIKHRERPIYGLQFHPEHLTLSSAGDEIFERILADIETYRS